MSDISLATPLDPFTRVYQVIRNQLLAFQPLIVVKNIPDLSSKTFDGFKEVTYQSLPELLLIQDDFTLQPFGRNSLRCDFAQTYRLICTIDQLQVWPINKLKWQAFAGLYQLGDDLGLSGLVETWIVRGGMDDAFGQKEWKRDTLRYLSALSITVSMYVSRQSLNQFGR